jgi:hypothetical protein
MGRSSCCVVFVVAACFLSHCVCVVIWCLLLAIVRTSDCRSQYVRHLSEIPFHSFYIRRVGVCVPIGSRMFTSPYRPNWLWGPVQPPIQWIQGIKRPKLEADHSPPSSAKIMKTWIYTPIAHTPSWHSAQLVKHRDNFTFLCT